MMQSDNRIIIAAAGSGKTTTIVTEALHKPTKQIAIITYTINNANEIRKKFFEINGSIPGHVLIYTWFSFLLQDCVRPYQNYCYDARRIESIAMIPGRSAKFIKRTNTKQYFLAGGKDIYTDKISEFACICNQNSGGKVIDRLSKIYDEIYIDEVQDLAGYDLELIELFLKSKIAITLVGDHRQATFSTNNSSKNKKYAGSNIIELFRLWHRKRLCTLDHHNHSYRCNQMICDLADTLFSDLPNTESRNGEMTPHDGVFLVPAASLEKYVAQYSPVILRYSRATRCEYSALNFGDSKGLTFDRVLIIPHGPLRKFLSSGDVNHVEASACKLYVAITRARFSVAFLYDGICRLDIPTFNT